MKKYYKARAGMNISPSSWVWVFEWCRPTWSRFHCLLKQKHMHI